MSLQGVSCSCTLRASLARSCWPAGGMFVGLVVASQYLLSRAVQGESCAGSAALSSLRIFTKVIAALSVSVCAPVCLLLSQCSLAVAAPVSKPAAAGRPECVVYCVFLLVVWCWPRRVCARSLFCGSRVPCSSCSTGCPVTQFGTRSVPLVLTSTFLRRPTTAVPAGRIPVMVPSCEGGVAASGATSVFPPLWSDCIHVPRRDLW